MSQPLPDVGPPVPDGDPADRPTAEADGTEVAVEDPRDDDPDRPRFRLGYVPGATPGKWAAVWHERLPDVRLELIQVEPATVATALAAEDIDAAIGRLPVDKEVFSAIPLYEETPVVCFSRDHLLAALADDEPVTSADLAEDVVWVPADDVLFATQPVPGRVPTDPDGNPLGRLSTTADTVATVAANVGVAVLPMSLARLHRRKDVSYRPLVDGPTAPVGLVWPIDRTTDLVEELIGIVRGRTVNSSRGRGGPAGRSADAGQPAGKAARTGAKKQAKDGSGASGRSTAAGGRSAAAGGRSGGSRGGAKGGGRAGAQRGGGAGGGGAQRAKGARPTPKGKKKGKGR